MKLESAELAIDKGADAKKLVLSLIFPEIVVNKVQGKKRRSISVILR
jgi:hypothetical protein